MNTNQWHQCTQTTPRLRKKNLSTVPFKIEERNLKYLEIKLSKYVDENYKTIKKKIEEDHENGELCHVPGLTGSTLSK